MSSLQERVVELIPSVSLKKAIRESGQELADVSLLAIVYYAAPDFDTRIRYIQLLEKTFTGELKRYARRILHAEQQMRDAFFKKENGVVYELHILEQPNAYDERYLCSSYEAALKMIPLFYREYDCEETSESRYRIVKRRVFAGDGQAFSEDWLGEVVLLPGRVLYSVHTECEGPEMCEGDCDECQLDCVRSDRLVFPRFLNHGDAVRYRGYEQAEQFGVVLQWKDAPLHECYIIPLNCAYIRYRDFENARDAHEHIPVFLVDRISPEELPCHMREDYDAYAAYVRENL